MKNIFKYTFLALLMIGVSACDSYFDVDLEQNIPTDEAYESVQDVQNGLIGAYYALGSYQFYGRDVVALGDMAADLAVAGRSYGHFVAINTYAVSETTEDLKHIWQYGYQVVDRATRTINGADKVAADAAILHLDEDDLDYLLSCKSQSYALRALSVFTLTNIFGLPYQPGQVNSQLGVCLLDKEPLEAFETIKRSTVEESYEQVLKDIAKAKEFYTGNFPTGTSQFYFNIAAISALEARVLLFMGNYADAKAAAQEAITLRGGGNVSNEMYVNMWSSTAVSDEDIFTIAKSDDDNLSANALNTLYGSYDGDVSTKTISSFNATDIRTEVLNTFAMKYQGTSTSQSTSNIPVFRKSEMYLIIAECEANLGNIIPSQNALAYTAKRDLSLVDEVTGEVNLPSTKDGLLDFIAEERIRELYLEGHRWFDIRRTGEIIDGEGFEDFDASKFVYPIPADEINAGFGTQQNEGWSENLPE